MLLNTRDALRHWAKRLMNKLAHAMPFRGICTVVTDKQRSRLIDIFRGFELLNKTLFNQFTGDLCQYFNVVMIFSIR
ncbi:hypothetical protein VCSRO11_0902 [Vibrio cholerae]|nr:hypothetical protein VCSRO11_0902 [Vibrio cholerae]